MLIIVNRIQTQNLYLVGNNLVLLMISRNLHAKFDVYSFLSCRDQRVHTDKKRLIDSATDVDYTS